MIQNGIDLIKFYEGCKLSAYKCPAGVWTIGWGSTFYSDGKPVKQGDTITQDKADGLLFVEIQRIKGNKKFQAMDISDDAADAVCALIYNVGEGSFYKSKLYSAICNKKLIDIIHNWDWITAGGSPLLGLARRRANELLIFLENL
jgi:lysozyme